MENKIYKPIFIVGCGRSGTTIFYNTLAWHSDLAWISYYSNHFYTSTPTITWLCNLYRSALVNKIVKRRIPTPDEGYRIWNWCKPVLNSPNDPPLTERDVDETVSLRCRKMVHDHIRYSRKKRFLNKNTRNSRRIKFLNQIFPDAKFIHMVRDARAVVASFLNVDWYKSLTPWFIEQKNNTSTSQTDLDPVELAAQLWKMEVGKVIQDMNCLDSKQYIELKYEDLASDPISTLKQVCDFCELKWSLEFEEFIRTINIKNMNYRYKQRLTHKQIMQVKKSVRQFAAPLGYILD
jgi:hypothetical protein